MAPPPTWRKQTREPTPALASSSLSLNLVVASVGEVAQTLALLRASAAEMQAIALVCANPAASAARRSSRRSSTTGQQAAHALDFTSEAHRAAVAEGAAKLASDKVRSLLPAALGAALAPPSRLCSLTLGVRLPAKLAELLADSLAGNASLQRLSMAGACCGDAVVTAIAPALLSPVSRLQVLALPGCCLTDAAAARLAQLLRAQAAAAAEQAWVSQLRGSSGSRGRPGRAAGDAEPCSGAPGLRVLDLAQNELTAASLRGLAAALMDEHGSLVQLGLAANKLPPPEQSAAALLRALAADPPASRRFSVDLRGNGGSSSGSDGAATVPELGLWAGALVFDGTQPRPQLGSGAATASSQRAAAAPAGASQRTEPCSAGRRQSSGATGLPARSAFADEASPGAPGLEPEQRQQQQHQQQQLLLDPPTAGRALHEQAPAPEQRPASWQLQQRASAEALQALRPGEAGEAAGQARRPTASTTTAETERTPDARLVELLQVVSGLTQEVESLEAVLQETALAEVAGAAPPGRGLRCS